MRVFLAGATGAIGSKISRQLVKRGHHVVGTSRSAAKAEALRATGVEPVVLDLLDAEAVRAAVLAARPEAILHEGTSLAGLTSLKHFDRAFATTNRLRTAGTDALLAAGREAGVARFLVQSYTGWPYARRGDASKTEDDPLDTEPVASMRQSLAAIVHLEKAVVQAGGIALRYGAFYGSLRDPQIDLVRKRLLPMIGDGDGIWSFVHLDDAAAATVLALERGSAGSYNIVDDEPAPVRQWLPLLASVIGAKPPLHIPRWLGRMAAGEAVVMMMTEARGASNQKAKRELGWTLRYPTWRQGFPAAYQRPAVEPSAHA
jgi:nucleoside-diphosphate-sugar epimerase